MACSRAAGTSLAAASSTLFRMLSADCSASWRGACYAVHRRNHALYRQAGNACSDSHQVKPQWTSAIATYWSLQHTLKRQSSSRHASTRTYSSTAVKPADSWRRVPSARPPPSSKATQPPSPAPDVAPVSEAGLQQVVNFIQAHPRLLVVTGAGCSTESNIPDYRGPNGAYTSGFKPMFHQQVRCTLTASKRSRSAAEDMHSQAAFACQIGHIHTT
jgi:hypothetical protein